MVGLFLKGIYSGRGATFDSLPDAAAVLCDPSQSDADIKRSATREDNNKW